MEPTWLLIYSCEYGFFRYVPRIAFRQPTQDTALRTGLNKVYENCKGHKCPLLHKCWLPVINTPSGQSIQAPEYLIVNEIVKLDP